MNSSIGPRSEGKQCSLTKSPNPRWTRSKQNKTEFDDNVIVGVDSVIVGNKSTRDRDKTRESIARNA